MGQAMGGTYKELDVKVYFLLLLQKDCIESNSFFSFDSATGWFFRVGRPHPEGGGPGQDKTLFFGRTLPSIPSQNDLNQFLGQSS